MSDWRKVYTGRDSELNELIESWEKVKSGGGPHVHLVRGERGMGKTRLVQEFYNYLSTHEDPDNYWPDHISTDGNTLLPGPDPDADELVKSHFENFNLKERKLPFLWWGFRIADPQQRNVIRASLTEHASTLTQHLVPLTIARDLELLRKKSGMGLGKDLFHDAGADIAADILEGALKEIPGISTASTIYSVGKRINDVRKTYKKELDENKAKQNSSLSVLYDVADKDIQDSTLDQLKLLNPKASRHWDKVKEKFSQSLPRQIPAIIFIDDAQFTGLGSGSGSLAVLARFWKWALYNKFPLLILATHWNYEWEESLGKPAPEDPERPLSFAEGFQPRSEDDRKHFSETILGRDVDLGAILQSALPQLSANDRALILEKSDGNPMLLREFLERLTDENLNWCDANGLTKIGQRQLQKKIFKLHELIRDRLENSTPVPIRKAILISALQGVEFIESVTLKAAEELKIDIGDDALKRARSPHAFIDFLDENKAAFIQRAVYDAALTLVDDVFEDEATVKAALGLATEILIANTSESKTQFSEAQLKQLKGFEIGYGLESDDSDIFSQALTNIEHEIESYMEGGGRNRDYAAAAELAQKWWEIVQNRPDMRLSIDHYNSARNALRTFYGSNSIIELSKRALKDAKALAETGLENSVSDLSRALIQIGDLESNLSNFDQAELYYIEALSNSSRFSYLNENLENVIYLIDALTGLGDLATDRSNWELARNYFEDSLELIHSSMNLGHEGGKAMQLRRPLLTTLENLGNVEAAQGNWEQARDYYTESLKNAHILVTETKMPEASHYISNNLKNLGELEEKQSNWEQARSYHFESLTFKRTLANERVTPDYQRSIAVSLSELGDLEEKLKNWEQAQNYYSEIVSIYHILNAEFEDPNDVFMLSIYLSRLGDMNAELNQWEEARQSYTETLDLIKGLSTNYLNRRLNSDKMLLEALRKLGDLEVKTSNLEQARIYYLESLALSRELLANLHTIKNRQSVLLFVEKLGDIENLLSNRKSARKYYEEAFQMSNLMRKAKNAPEFHRAAYILFRKKFATETFFKRGVPKPIRFILENSRHSLMSDLQNSLEKLGCSTTITDVKQYLNTGQLPPKKDQK